MPHPVTQGGSPAPNPCPSEDDRDHRGGGAIGADRQPTLRALVDRRRRRRARPPHACDTPVAAAARAGRRAGARPAPPASSFATRRASSRPAPGARPIRRPPTAADPRDPRLTPQGLKAVQAGTCRARRRARHRAAEPASGRERSSVAGRMTVPVPADGGSARRRFGRENRRCSRHQLVRPRRRAREPLGDPLVDDVGRRRPGASIPRTAGRTSTRGPAPPTASRIVTRS